ncbi:uncharacterized protein EV420DRAFT_1484119 [Desarmillaria tabescens]|uniref:Uncharacterized protein n=1 Tax=Armillaria tabescens TaxID=1929756 RepID=A0AA39JPM5_ARMTA|nr:uncharacterized protein EV420DRAFT_1484119 [Desarmillaria tabescens]KAK0446483.1 hypothetical protein EV420DRAFT_1484119 [Desarmillaria tabescens]
MSATSQPSVVRRPQARKRVNDDASYFGPPGALKRQAVERVDGEPRMKRKRIEPVLRDPMDTENRISFVRTPTRFQFTFPLIVFQVEFDKMPMTVIYKYLTHFDIIPAIYPSPLRADDPSPPSVLNLPPHQPSRPSSPPLAATPANRPRRDPKELPNRQKHFRDTLVITGREEVDTLASFMCAVEKTKGGKLFCKPVSPVPTSDTPRNPRTTFPKLLPRGVKSNVDGVEATSAGDSLQLRRQLFVLSTWSSLPTFGMIDVPSGAGQGTPSCPSDVQCPALANENRFLVAVTTGVSMSFSIGRTNENKQRPDAMLDPGTMGQRLFFICCTPNRSNFPIEKRTKLEVKAIIGLFH